MTPSLLIFRVGQVRQSLLNLIERSRGPRARVTGMWKVRLWRAYEGTIGGMPMADAAVSAGTATPVVTGIGEIALSRRGGFGRD